MAMPEDNFPGFVPENRLERELLAYHNKHQSPFMVFYELLYESVLLPVCGEPLEGRKPMSQNVMLVMDSERRAHLALFTSRQAWADAQVPQEGWHLVEIKGREVIGQMPLAWGICLNPYNDLSLASLPEGLDSMRAVVAEMSTESE